jgi:hypothetical protein
MGGGELSGTLLTSSVTTFVSKLPVGSSVSTSDELQRHSSLIFTTPYIVGPHQSDSSPSEGGAVKGVFVSTCSGHCADW